VAAMVKEMTVGLYSSGGGGVGKLIWCQWLVGGGRGVRNTA